jgi:hypothetical protein
MDTIFISLVAQQLGGALLFFPIVWIVIRKMTGQKLSISNSWLISGLFATAIGAATVRFMAIFVIGGEAALHPEGGLQVFFFLVLPVIVAIGVCAFLRTKAYPIAKAEN